MNEGMYVCAYTPGCTCACSQVPVFVQVQQKWRRMYVGQCEGPGVRTDFEMVHLRKAPAHYGHLSGLLDVFKSKIVREFGISGLLSVMMKKIECETTCRGASSIEVQGQ